MDTTDPDIRFDWHGQCNHCTEAFTRLRSLPVTAAERRERLEQLVDAIKKEGQGRDYDCVIGLSGGVDSTMVAYTVRQLGLRALAVHFDNGWNSELAVVNIARTLDNLDLDLFTYVVDWEEFRDLQLAFIRASVANCEAPTDHGITATLFRTAERIGTRYILSGSNLATETIMPTVWAHYNQDLRHLRALHRRFSARPLKTMPTISVEQYLHYVFRRRIRQIPFLNYIDYDRDAAKALLTREIGWRDYGGKHYESVWTRFFQGYYLVQKFGYDKRKAHYSSMICAGLMTREEALTKLEEPAYDPRLFELDRQFVLKKFELRSDEFERLMRAPGRPVTDFPSNLFLFHRMRPIKNVFRAIATRA